jgi:hypothetical protein
MQPRPTTYSVFAAHAASAIVPCADARPQNGGQGGWSTGVHFSDCRNLVQQLRDARIYRREVRRLGVVAHGRPGSFWINREPENLHVAAAQDPDLSDVYGWTHQNLTMPRVLEQIHLIGHYLSPYSNVLLLGCNSASGPEGTALLEGLSRLWPDVRVHGYVVTLLASGPFRRFGAYCNEPGVRATGSTGSVGRTRVDQQLPQGYESSNPAVRDAWVDESHPLVKTAFNGRITREPAAGPSSRSAAPGMARA